MKVRAEGGDKKKYEADSLCIKTQTVFIVHLHF